MIKRLFATQDVTQLNPFLLKFEFILSLNSLNSLEIPSDLHSDSSYNRNNFREIFSVVKNLHPVFFQGLSDL